MSEIRIHRDHSLGLAKARKLAWKWAEEVEDKFDMACSVIEGELSDTVEFSRSGVHGRLIVAPDHFDLEAKLGFLLGAFARTIEREIEKNLDDLLGSAAAAAPQVAAARSAADKTGNGKVGTVKVANGKGVNGKGATGKGGTPSKGAGNKRPPRA